MCPDPEDWDHRPVSTHLDPNASVAVLVGRLDQSLVDLRRLVDVRFRAQDRLLDERFETQTKQIDKAFEAQQTALAAALTLAGEKDRVVEERFKSLERLESLGRGRAAGSREVFSWLIAASAILFSILTQVRL